MRKWIIYVMVAVVLIVFMSKCSTTEQLLLIVQCTAGVDGNPQAGSYEYDTDTAVPYNYTAATGYENVQVSLDGQPAAASGTITMNADHTLSIGADRIQYFQGNWLVDVFWSVNTCAMDSETGMIGVGTQNGDNVTFVVTTPTLPVSVTCVGTIDAQGNFDLTADVDHGGGVTMHYHIQGHMTGRDAMTATIDAEGYYQGNITCTATGTMNAFRQ